jgi:hypothetical protein
MFSLFLMAALSLSPTLRCQCSYHSCYCEDSCNCSASAGKLCDKKCPCDFAFVQAVAPVAPAETKACPADDSGTAFFLDGKQCGWLCHAEMKYYPMLPSGNFGAACPIPKGATTVKPTATIAPSTVHGEPIQLRSCTNNGVSGIGSGQYYMDASGNLYSVGGASGCANGNCRRR